LKFEKDSDLTCETVREDSSKEVHDEGIKSQEARGNLKLMKKKHLAIKVKLDEMKI
jgi:hypothetical protein